MSAIFLVFCECSTNTDRSVRTKHNAEVTVAVVLVAFQGMGAIALSVKKGCQTSLVFRK